MSQHNEGKILPERLHAARKNAGLTQVTLANKVGLHPVTIAKWEIGLHQPSELVLRALAEQLGVSVRYLKGEDDKPASVVTKVTAAQPCDEELIRSVYAMVEKLGVLLEDGDTPENKAELATKLTMLCLGHAARPAGSARGKAWSRQKFTYSAQPEKTTQKTKETVRLRDQQADS